MTLLRVRTTEVVAWCMVTLALCMGFPSTLCRCVDGRLRLFCDAHNQLASAKPAEQSPLAKSGCCQRNKRITTVGHPERTAPAAVRLASQECTRITSSPTVAPKPISNQTVLNQTVGLYSIPTDLDASVAALAATHHAACDADPPEDLVIAFHCFLI